MLREKHDWVCVQVCEYLPEHEQEDRDDTLSI